MAEKTESKTDSVGGQVKVVKKPIEKVVKKVEKSDVKEGTKLGNEKKSLVKPMEEKSKNQKLKTILMSVIVVTLGLISGYGLFQLRAGGGVGTISFEEMADKELTVGDVIGSSNEEIFSDEVEGVILKGGIDGEGSHRLLRPGGESQTVYMTSTVLDLDKFVDHRVKVWGETFDAQKAGWLMDVGRVEVMELNAEKPFEEE